MSGASERPTPATAWGMHCRGVAETGRSEQGCGDGGAGAKGVPNQPLTQADLEVGLIDQYV